MSHYDYLLSREISAKDPPFASLIMAAMRKADSINILILKTSFPKIYEELQVRYFAPGGLLPDEVNEKEETKNGKV